MFEAIDNPYLVPYKKKTQVKDWSTRPPKDAPDEEECKRKLKKLSKKLHDLQRVLYAHDNHSVLLVFQAMDAAGKDSTIRAVLTGVNPAGCQVFSFKQPSKEELDHDFLWRSTVRLPERGRIGVFNRSYYEEVLVVRVHPEYLKYQKLPDDCMPRDIWDRRFTSIRDFERHMAESGTVIIKFWLNLSKEEQAKRFIRRIDEQDKNWKFSVDDVKERGHWDEYMDAYEEVLSNTSREWAPWYAIPADNKPYMRYIVAKTIVENLESLDLHYPKVDEEQRRRLQEMREQLA